METKYKGDLKGFPEEVVEKMLYYQEKQGNVKDITVFEYSIIADYSGGFNWVRTEEGHDFWSSVILSRKFDVFFKKYPKRGKEIIGYKLKNEEYRKAALALCHVLNFADEDKDSPKSYCFSAVSTSRAQIEAAGVLDIWFKPVYKESDIFVKMQSNTGDFELEVSSKGIYYRPDNVFLNIGDLREIVGSIRTIVFGKRNNLTTNSYNVLVNKIDVGCKKDTLISDWKNVLEIYDTLIK